MSLITFALPEEVQTIICAFDASRARADLGKLCSVEFAGRRIGTPGHDLAQIWLAEQMRAVKLETQVFSFIAQTSVIELTALPMFDVIGADGASHSLKYRTEFQEHPQSVFQPTPVEGVVSREANAGSPTWLIVDAMPAPETVRDLMECGVVGLLVPQHAGPQGYLPKRITMRISLPLAVVSVRGDILAELDDKIVRATMPLRSAQASGSHVLGQLTGTDIRLKDAPLIVGAHFDGVGDDVSSLRLPGASDNAAGVAVVLEMARVLGTAKLKPRRPIIFVAFDGEEINALGSQAYAQALKAEGKTPIVINLDGAARFHDAVWAELSENAEALIQALDRAGEWLEIPLTTGAVGSDNRRFAQVGFPTVGLALGGVGGHTPADTVDQVDPDAMRMAGRLILAAVWQLAFN